MAKYFNRGGRRGRGEANSGIFFKQKVTKETKNSEELSSGCLDVALLKIIRVNWCPLVVNFFHMIRTATEEDRPVWIELRKLVYTDCSDTYHHEDIGLWLRDEDKECFLAEVDGEIVGFLEASLRNVVDGCLTSPVGYMEGICVFPEYRGRGISKALIAAAEDWMVGKGCSEMGSDADLDNEAAIEFHKAIGYEETFRIVQFKKQL